MTLNIPPGVPAAGAVSVVFVPGGLTAPASPTLVEINDTDSVNISCHLMSDGFGTTADQQNGTARRLCSAEQYDVPGPNQRGFNALKYVYDVQNPASATNKAYVGLVDGATGDLIIRWGKPGKSDFATGDVVDVYSVRLGPKNKETPEDTGELVVTQAVAWTGTVNLDVTVAAGA